MTYEVVTIHGLIQFPQEISMPGEFIGKEYTVRIGGIDGMFFMPSFPVDFYESKSLSALSAPLCQQEIFSKDLYWGDIHSWPKGDSVVRLCSLRFEVNEENLQSVSNSISAELQQWRASLIEKISVIWKADFRKRWDPSTIHVSGSGLFDLFYYDRSGHKERIFPANANNTVMVVPNRYTLYDGALQDALTFASLRYTTRLPYLYLLDAEFALRHDLYRKSILDTATAMEVCLIQMMDLAVSSLQKKQIKKLKRIHNSLSKRRRFLRKIPQFTIPYTEAEFELLLDRVRNKVIHEGYLPTAKEAANAYAMVTKTIKVLLPEPFFA